MQAGDYHIFMGTREIASMMERLSRTFTEKGIDNHFFKMFDYSLEMQQDRNEPQCLRSFMCHTDKMARATGAVQQNFWAIVQMVDCIRVFVFALLHYNVYIYIFGEGIFQKNKFLRKIRNTEFIIEKALGKKMVMWYCGSDSRAPYCDIDIYRHLDRATKARAARVQRIEKYMPVIDFPASAHFHRRSYIKYNCIGVPIDAVEIVEPQPKIPGVITIAHCPSVMKVKGTDVVRKVVKELQQKYKINYIEVTNLPHNEVLKALSKADIVIDQMYADTPMAGLASEACANGIPVVVCGYYAHKFREIFPEYYCPDVFCLPEELYQEVEKLLCDEALRKQIGEREKNFIEHEQKADIVAEKFLKIIEGEVPDSWLYNPSCNDYVYGGGISKERVIQNVVKMIDEFGLESLCLVHGSALEKAYVDLYNEHKNSVS